MAFAVTAATEEVNRERELWNNHYETQKQLGECINQLAKMWSK